MRRPIMVIYYYIKLLQHDVLYPNPNNNTTTYISNAAMGFRSSVLGYLPGCYVVTKLGTGSGQVYDIFTGDVDAPVPGHAKPCAFFVQRADQSLLVLLRYCRSIVQVMFFVSGTIQMYFPITDRPTFVAKTVTSSTATLTWLLCRRTRSRGGSMRYIGRYRKLFGKQRPVPLEKEESKRPNEIQLSLRGRMLVNRYRMVPDTAP